MAREREVGAAHRELEINEALAVDGLARDHGGGADGRWSGDPAALATLTPEEQAALGKALKERRIWGAGLDVFEDEPRVHPSIVESEHAVLTPHIGSAEEKYRLLMTEMVSENARAILAGKEPPNRIG